VTLLQGLAEYAEVLVEILDEGLCLVQFLGILRGELNVLDELFRSPGISTAWTTSIDQLPI
jgi:hypothetical protein